MRYRCMWRSLIGGGRRGPPQRRDFFWVVRGGNPGTGGAGWGRALCEEIRAGVEAAASQCKAPSINCKRAVGIVWTAGTRDGKRAARIVRYGSSSRIYEQAVGGVCTGDRHRVGAAGVDVGSQAG